MWIALGLIVLAVCFVVFGSKEEEASILYYYMEDDMEAVATETTENVEAPADIDDGQVAADAPQQDAAAMARDIYNGIEL